MHLSASDLASVLESDLVTHGWNGARLPYPGAPARQYAMMSLARSLLKKFHNEERSSKRDNAALELFLKTNSACGEFAYDTSMCTTPEAVALGEARDFIYTFFYPNDSSGDQLLTLRKISEGFAVGDGANIGTKSTSLYGKLALSSMAATSADLHDLYVQATFCGNRTWNLCETKRNRAYGREVVQGSRLSFVPKSAEISRTICTEPVLNMLFQKGIAALLEGRLRQVVGIDLARQPDKNRTLARIGSETGKFGTIDLSSASDSMSLNLVRNMFPPSVTRWLERTRCPVTILPDGTKVTLHMVSSMGNAFTFPLQTLFFSALVLGAYKVCGITPTHPKGWRIGNYAVFGDDIIVDQRAYRLVCRLLEITGFTVNKDKSFNEGLFRESCGHDYYNGYNVRGVYIKTLLHAGDCYSAINRLNRWSARHRVPLPNTIEYLCQGLRKLYVPFDEDDSAGVKVPRHMLKNVVTSKFTGGIRYRFMMPRPRQVRLPDSAEISESQKARLSGIFGRWDYNPDGLLISLLHGSIRNRFVGLRSNVRHVVQSTRYSSRWDYIPYDPFERKGFGEDWKVFTWLNLDSVLE